MIIRFARRTIGRSVGRSFGWPVERLPIRLTFVITYRAVGGSLVRSFGRSVDCSFNMADDRLASRMVGRTFGWSVAMLDKHSITMDFDMLEMLTDFITFH